MNRLAVSLAISRRSQPGEVLLVERSKNLRFFGGFLAFPGGTLDGDDETVTVRGLADETMSRFIVAGARELFEETGLWLGRGGTSPALDQLRADRRRLLAEEIRFGELLERNGQHLDGSELSELCRITTPPFAPVRYDTRFLRGLVADDAEIEIWDGELVAGEFVEPSEILARWRHGDVQIAPPMIVLLDEWAKGQDGLEHRIRSVTESYRAGALHRVYFSPGILLAPLQTPTRPPATHTNTCIVGEERLYVVDPSPVDEREQARLWDLLDDLTERGRKLEGILLTHYHPDHVGALAPMQRRYGVPAFAHADCAAELPEASFGATLAHGDTVELGRAPDGSDDWKLHVYHVPGHARGHLAFQDSRYRAIIVGDLVSTISSILIDPSDGHLVTYLHSLELLRSVTTAALYPGHGPPARDGRKVIEHTLEHRREREEQLVAALSTQPQSARALVESIYADVPSTLHALAERSLLSGLIKLEEEGRVRHGQTGYALV